MKHKRMVELTISAAGKWCGQQCQGMESWKDNCLVFRTKLRRIGHWSDLLRCPACLKEYPK